MSTIDLYHSENDQKCVDCQVTVFVLEVVRKINFHFLIQLIFLSIVPTITSKGYIQMIIGKLIFLYIRSLG